MRLDNIIALVVGYGIGFILLIIENDPIDNLTKGEGFAYVFIGVSVIYSLYLWFDARGDKK